MALLDHDKTEAEKPSKSADSRSFLQKTYDAWDGKRDGKPASRPLFWLSMIALVLQTGLLFLAFFEPPLPYTVAKSNAEAPDSPQFAHLLSSLTGASQRHYEQLEVLPNGENYYPAELAALRGAQKNINIEAYIFQKGKVADEFISVLAERARAGVQVKLITDAVGSASLHDSDMKQITDAGGRIAFYHPLRWYTWPRYNNRTHRELIVVDGNSAFIGGSGVADHWRYNEKDNPRWRDTMVHLTGEAVTGLQSTFAENWLESTGEILAGAEYFPIIPPVGTTPALTVTSSPGAGRSTEARLLFQVLMASAKKTIYITTPYFLPDSSVRDELIRAIKNRHVDVRILVPGHKSDHALTRNSSRRLYGDLLQAGAHIHEYQPSMIHAKVMIIDSLWGVVGSTNFDARSFGLNDEVNLVVSNPQFAATLTSNFNTDLQQSKEITYEQWKNRPWLERAQEVFGAFIQQQQ